VGDSGRTPIVAVDAMGGDLGPETVVPGAVAAQTDEGGFTLRLYGRPDEIEAVLAPLPTDGLAIEVVGCEQDIAMGESPATAIRGKPDSPIVKAMHDQSAGDVDAVVSAGNTGAMVAASLIVLGRLASVDRPAIASLVPTAAGDLLMLDVGANVQCTPEHLVTFAHMGLVYAREMQEVPDPTLGLLNIGEEESKGSELTVAAHALLKESSLNFLGNVESMKLLFKPVDVVVTDGYTGNIVLKMVEGFGHVLGELVKNAVVEEDVRRALPAVLSLLKRKFSYEAYGGALLLGIDGVSIIAHGRSSSLAITNAVKVARRQVELGIPAKLQTDLAG